MVQFYDQDRSTRDNFGPPRPESFPQCGKIFSTLWKKWPDFPCHGKLGFEELPRVLPRARQPCLCGAKRTLGVPGENQTPKVFHAMEQSLI